MFSAIYSGNSLTILTAKAAGLTLRHLMFVSLETAKEKRIYTVVQPDLSIVCDPGKLDDRGCKGAPDLIVEVISPSSLKLDLTLKKRLYERVGVKEYWIVYPHERIAMVYVRDDQGMFTDGETYDKDAVVPIGIFENFKIDMSSIFVFSS